MKTLFIAQDEWLRLVDQRYNPPDVRDQGIRFQAEIRLLYYALREQLSVFGEEGDYYGVSDFTIMPDLRDRPSVKAPPAACVREFCVTVLTKKFFQSNYLRALHDFVVCTAPDYRVIISKDFDPSWALRIALTADLVQIYCTNTKERAGIQEICANL